MKKILQGGGADIRRRVFKLLNRKLVVFVVGTFLYVTGASAFASEYGCKVMMCLSHPKGPKAVADCVSPINQLEDDMKHGRSFPTCDEAKDSVKGDSFARPGYSYFDPCPTGTQALPAGQYGLQRGSTQLYAGIGEGDGMSFSQENGIPPKICVAGPVGQGSYGNYDNQINYTIYSTVVVQQPAGNPRYADIYVNNKLYQRIRY